MNLTKEDLEGRLSALSQQKNILETQLRNVQQESLQRVAKLNADIQATHGAMQLCAEFLDQITKAEVADAEPSGRTDQ